MIQDISEDIFLTWRVDGKVKTVKQSDNKPEEFSLSFDYKRPRERVKEERFAHKQNCAGEMGQRPEFLGSETIAKHAYDKQGVANGGLGNLVKTTYYVLDATGNVMSVYEREVDASAASVTFEQAERHIYGSSRLGVMNASVPLLGTQNDSYSQTSWIHTIGQRTYELANHLGNVLSVISDKPIPHDNGSGTADYFLADIRQAQDYSPFGVTLPGRVFGGSDHRFGFQNQEFDPETGYVNYKYRMHDPRLGRFFAIDPLASKYSYNSPYSFSENCVIDCIELEGLEKIRHHVYSEEKKKWVVAWVETDKNLKENVNAYHKFNYKGQNYQTVVKPIYKTPGKAESVTYNGNIKPGSDNRENMYMQFKSTAEAKMSQSEKNQEAAVNNSISNDPTNYMSWEGGANGADGQLKQTKKDYVVGGKVVLGIATFGYGAGALIAGEVGVVTVGSTVFAADDLTGTVVGAAKNDMEGEHKPLKQVFTAVGGNYGTITYDGLNLSLGGFSKFNNLKDLIKFKTTSIIPNALDNYGLSNGVLETTEDVKQIINPSNGTTR